MKKLFPLCLFLVSCFPFVDSDDEIVGGGDGDTPKPSIQSVADYDIKPNMEISKSLATVISQNPSINEWYFPEGEYNFSDFDEELAKKLSSKKLYGATNELTIFNFNSTSPKNLEWDSVSDLYFHNISWKNARIIISGESSDITFDGSIFYGLEYSGDMTADHYQGDVKADHFIVFGDYNSSKVAKDLTIRNSVFLRSSHKKEVYKNTTLPDKAGAANESDNNYMVRREYGIRIMTADGVYICDNVFGLRSQDVSSSKTFAKTSDLAETIARAETLLKDNAKQNYFTTAINTVPNTGGSYDVSINDAGTDINGTLPVNMAKNIRIIHNVFNGWFSRDYSTDSLVSFTPVADDNRFFDHAVYLRGTCDTIFGGNYVRGWPNDSAGGIKFKSGIKVSIVKNFFDNTGIILARDWELGAPSSTKGIYFKVLVQDNYLDLYDATGSYKMGITYDDHHVKSTTTDVDLITDLFSKRVRKMIFVDNTISKMTITSTWFTGSANSSLNPNILRLDDIHSDLLAYTSLSDSIKSTGIQVKNNKYEDYGNSFSDVYKDRVEDMRIIEDRTKLSDNTKPMYLYSSDLSSDVLGQHSSEISKIQQAKKW